GLRAPAVRADRSTEKALAELLQGTGIHYEFLNDHTIVLAGAVVAARPFRTAEPPEPVVAAQTAPSDVPVAQAEPSAVPDQAAAAPTQPPAPTVPTEPTTEVMVTGSR